MKKLIKILWLKLSGQWFKPYKAVLSWQPKNRRGDHVTETSFNREMIQKYCDKLNQINLNK